MTLPDSLSTAPPAMRRAWDVVTTPGAWAWLGLACLLAAGLCSSLFFFGGHKVDESEVVMNALAIAAGGWEPTWSPGYGHLAMYLPGFALWLVAAFLQVAGMADSHADALYLLFVDDGAYRIVRFLYALADVGTALVLARIVWRVSGQKLLAAAFVLYLLVSPDTWFYANFIRTDTLVSFFTACAALVLVEPRGRWTPWLLGIALGAAVACKYSAVVYAALIGLLLIPGPSTDAATLRQRAGMAAIAATVMVVSTFLFQPHFDYSGILSAIDKHLSGAHFTKEVVPLAQRWDRLWALVLKVEPWAPWLLLAALGALARPLRNAPVLALVALGIAPFALSNFPREYWLLPFADALRAAAWLGIGTLLAWAGRRFGSRPAGIAAGLVLAVVAVVAIARFHGLAQGHRTPARVSNAEAARRWLYAHVANRKPLLYVYEKNYQLPRAYSFASYEGAALFSRVFIFERNGFESLHALFRRRLYSAEYADFSSITRVPDLRLSMRAGQPAPQLCAGSRCFDAKPAACSSAAMLAIEQCAAYVWDMDRPALRQDLAKMAFKLPGPSITFATCWYDCGNPDAEIPVHRRHDGLVPMVDVADRLFASSRVLPLKALAKMDRQGGETYLVTTPAAYRAWLKGKARGSRDPGAAFAKAINAKLVRYFDAGPGPRIEVYRLRPAARG